MTTTVWTTLTPGQKRRVHQWVDTKTLTPFFGLQARVAPRVWAHIASRDGKPLFFASREDAEQARRA